VSNTYINLTFESKIDWVKKINEYQEEIKRLKEEYMILQNASDEVEEEKDKEIERLNNIINGLEKYLEEIKDRVIMYGIDDDTYKTTNLYRDMKNKIKELKGDVKE
jgi:lipid II:glycine glycyltransferase (peptidoglycan interpeptide bridge formation enzyme)